MPTSHPSGSNAIDVTAADGVVWAIDGGAGRVECLDQQTGKARDGWDVSGGAVIGGDSSGIFIGTVDGLNVLNVDPTCRQ